MKTLLVSLALALAVAAPSFAAIQYDFVQKNTSDDAVVPSRDLTGRATVDGEGLRVEFLSGNLYPAGTYVVSTDASRRLFFVDPTKEWYTEVNTAGIATALGTSGIEIENLNSKTEILADKPKIAGYDTIHHRVTLTYDMQVIMRGIALKQNVQTELDMWTSTEIVAGGADFLTGSMKTGDPDLDQLFAAETSKVAGFPLRQLVTIRTRYDLPQRSNLQRPTTRTITRETWVTAVRHVPPDASAFNVPATYRRSDQPEIPKTATEILTFEEPPSR